MYYFYLRTGIFLIIRAVLSVELIILNELVDALVYKVGEFVVRHIRPDEGEEIQDPFIHIYRD
jgi:hypothetical protein